MKTFNVTADFVLKLMQSQLDDLTANELDSFLDILGTSIYGNGWNPLLGTSIYGWDKKLDKDDLLTIEGLYNRVINGPTNWIAEIDDGKTKEIKDCRMSDALNMAKEWAEDINVSVYHNSINKDAIKGDRCIMTFR
jgi:hypothetical protein